VVAAKDQLYAFDAALSARGIGPFRLYRGGRTGIWASLDFRTGEGSTCYPRAPTGWFSVDGRWLGVATTDEPRALCDEGRPHFLASHRLGSATGTEEAIGAPE